MMNFLCTGVTTNVSDKEKHPRIKDYKLLNFLKLPLLFLTYFFFFFFPPPSPLASPSKEMQSSLSLPTALRSAEVQGSVLDHAPQNITIIITCTFVFCLKKKKSSDSGSALPCTSSSLPHFSPTPDDKCLYKQALADI